MVIGFTGHRFSGLPMPNPLYIQYCQKLEKLLLEYKPEYCISGMALGFDQHAAFVCHNLKIPFVAAIPCDNQDYLWNDKQKKTYNSLLQKSIKQVNVSPGPYAAWKMQARNKYIVDNCNLLIACYDGSPGGTANCIQYAKSISKQIINLL